MSLQVWLPLNGTLDNQGLSNVTVTNNGATVNNNGKIGKCYYFTPNQWIKISLPAEMTTIKNITVAAWVKSHSTTMALGGISHNGAATLAGITLYSSGWQLSGGGSWKYVNGGTIANTQVWHHVTCTIGDDEIITYLDGVKITSSTLTAQAITNTTLTSTDNFIEIGCDHPGGDEYFTGYVNDFRIYDHELSAKEVKELSKGLVLHYKLNQKIPLTNLKKNSTYNVYNNFTKSGTTGSLTKLNEQFQGCDVYRLTMTPDSSRVSHFQNTLHSHGIYGFSITFAASTKYCFWIYYRPVTHQDIRVGGTASNIGGWTEIPPKKYNNEWYVVGQYRNGSVTEAKTDSIFTSFYTPTAATDIPISIDFCCPHLVQGTTEIIDDGDYQEIIGHSIEYDCSGYGNNGTIIGTLITSSDTPRYNSSMHIEATTAKIHISGLTTSGFGNSYSFSWWGKRANNSPMFWGFSDGIRLNGMYIGNLWNTGDGSNNPLYNIGTTTQVTAPSVNVWHHYVMTGNGTKCYVYLDGVLWAEAKTYKAISGTSIYINGWDSGTSYCSNNTNISDFRIYATALSADDVKELYQIAASIDNHGNVHAYEVVE